MKLKGERIVIRDIKYSDSYDFYEYGKDPLVGPMAGWKPFPSKEVSDRILTANIINKEITRKRAEFGLETLDYVGQTLAEKRMAQAEKALNTIKSSSAYNSAYDEAVNSVLKLIARYETEDFASIRAIADTLETLNADLFGKPLDGERKSALQYLREAADALESYEAYK